MFKKILVSVILIYTVRFAIAQDISDSLFSKFSYNSTSLSGEPDFYIFQLTDDASHEIKSKLVLSATRKLSANIFIVKKELYLKSNVPLKFQKKLLLANNYWKLSPLAENLFNKKNKHSSYRFTIKIETGQSQTILENVFQKEKKIEMSDANFISLTTTIDNIEKYFLNDNNVTGIDILMNEPKAELGVPEFDLSANKINLVNAEYPSLHGEGEHVSIKEDYYDTTDIDMKGRYEPSPLASHSITNHANFMATIIAGAGNSVYYARGVAPAAKVSSSSFEGVLPDDDSYYLQNNISVQNHSYGTNIDNSYGLNAVAFDKSANDNSELLHVFSSGNSGTDISQAGNFAGIGGYANITGNFKMAKNVLVVGAVDSFGIVAPLSSRGPSYDGRMLPDLVAFQKNGTSESAALVSGTSVLLQQEYRLKNNNSVLPSALAKAILINTADDINNPGPDFETGFGNLNAIRAMECIEQNKIFSGNVSQGMTKSFQITIPQNISLLKVTLAWNDTAASEFAPKALVNDLDLELTLPATNEQWQPWVLNSYPDADSLKSIATRKRDSLNNEEQITLQNPVAGNYQINVKGFDVATSGQNFYIAYSMDSLNDFKWQRLADSDFAESGMLSIIRWQSSFSGTGTIEYRYIDNSNWNNISTVDLSQKYFTWTAPDTIGQALLRMKIGNTYFYSDTFLITTLLQPKVGFICGDSVLVYWNKLKNIEQYKIYRLGAQYMEPFLNVADTSVIISRNDLSNNFLAVSPVLPNGFAGTKSYAFDYTLQGSGCFINSFFVNANANIAALTLDIGTHYQVDSISFEKLTASGYVNIFSTTIHGLEYTYNYLPLATGVTFFRAKIILSNGQVIYSNPESVFYVEPGKYLLIPVPVKRSTDLNLYTTLPDGEIISIVDVMGRIVLKKEIQFTREVIRTSSLQAGEYFYRITKQGSKTFSGKLIVL